MNFIEVLYSYLYSHCHRQLKLENNINTSLLPKNVQSGGGVPFVQAHFSCIFVIFLKICFGHNSAGISRISMKINQIKATIKNQIFPAPGPHRTSKMKKNSQKKKITKKCTKSWGGEPPP